MNVKVEGYPFLFQEVVLSDTNILGFFNPIRERQ